MDGFGHCLLLLQAEIDPPRANGWLILGVLAVVFIAPFFLGNLIGRLLRLNDLSGRISVVLMSLFMALAPFVYMEIAGQMEHSKLLADRAKAESNRKEGDPELPPLPKAKSWMDAIHLGIDLAGGTNLVYEIDVAAAKLQGKTVNKETVDKMVQAIAKRINPSGAEEVAVRRVGADRIEVIIPGADPDLVRQKKALIVKLGSLEFGIVAEPRYDQQLIDQAAKLPENENEYRPEGQIIAAWHDVSDPTEREQNWNSAGNRTVTRFDPQTGAELLRNDAGNGLCAQLLGKLLGGRRDEFADHERQYGKQQADLHQHECHARHRHAGHPHHGVLRTCNQLRNRKQRADQRRNREQLVDVARQTQQHKCNDVQQPVVALAELA